MNLSPFRYPGSKNKLLKPIMKILNTFTGKRYIDVFCGGGSVMLEMAKNNKDIEIIINDGNDWISFFWKIILTNKEELKDKIQSNPPSVNLFKSLRSVKPLSDIDKAFYAIFFNRTTFSGIFTSGPIGGYEQKSKWTINCRYNISTILKQIDCIDLLLKDRTQIYNLNYKEFIETYIEKEDIVYLDPPYYVKGDMLYPCKMSVEEHMNMSVILKNRNFNFLLSYDNCEEIKKLYNWANIKEIDMRYSINGIKDNWKDKTELLITKPHFHNL